MNNGVFYNRTRETKKMVEIINKKGKSNRVIILAGKTGIGKSAFVDRILSKELHDLASIRVNICKASSDTIENLYYINVLYRTLAKLAGKKQFDNIHNPIQQGIGSLKNLLSFGIDVLLDKTVGDGNTFYEPAEEPGVLRKKDYIISVFKKHAFIVTIDNIQDIDVQSLEILRDILNQVINTTFILEYTEKDDTSDSVLSFFNTMKQYNAAVFFLEMKQLAYSEAKKLAPENLNEYQIRELYQHSHGNLVKMQLADPSMGIDDNPIAVRLAKLSKDERFLVNLLYLNESPIHYDSLYQMLIGNMNAPPFSEQKLCKCLKNLKNAKIIRIIDYGEIRIYHDSIIAQLDCQPPSALLYSAYSIIKAFYEEKLNNCQNNEAIEHLFSLYIHFSDEDLLTIFPQISQLIRSFKYPHTVISKLVSYRERIQRKGNLNPQLYCKLVTLLVNLCQEYGLWEEALNNLDLIYDPQNPYHRALRAAALSLNFSNEKSIQSIHALVQAATSPREKLTAELCLLSAEMARQPREKSIQMAQKMLNTVGYSDCMEYGFLLSNYAELVNDTQECIHLYRQAIERFHVAGHNQLAANILVFLSMVYAYNGRILDARKALELGKKIGEIRESYLLNNGTVLDILEGNVTTDSATRLTNALLLTCDPYERILIQCNLLVCLSLLGEKKRSEQVMLEITSQPYEQFRYEEFLHIVYQDLLFYFTIVNRDSEIKKYRNLIQELVDNSTSNSMFAPIAKLQLENQSSPNLFYSQFPFRVDFLGSWSIEISPDLENS